MSRSTTRRTMRLSAVMIAGALVFAACGGDDGADDSSGGGSASTVEGDGTAGESTDDSKPMTGDANSDFCKFAREFDEQGDAIGDELSSFDSSGDDLRKAFESFDDSIDQLVRLAPSEIKGDVETVAAAFGEFIDVLADYDYSIMAAATDPEAAERLEVLDSAEVQAANERISAYLEDVCGIEQDDFDGTGSGDGDMAGDDEMVDALSQSYAAIWGIEVDQARCVVEQLFDETGQISTEAMMRGDQIFTDCGVDPSKAGALGG
jgi:hypothetical protein